MISFLTLKPILRKFLKVLIMVDMMSGWVVKSDVLQIEVVFIRPLINDEDRMT